jgi:choice-of-anchor A domain-containing protein
VDCARLEYHIQEDTMMKSSAFLRRIVVALALAAWGQTAAADLMDLGAAETLGIFAWGWGNKLDMTDSQCGLYGRYGLGPQAIQQFTAGFITDGYWTDPLAYDSHAHGVTTTPGGATLITPVLADLAPAEADVLAASDAAAGLTPTQTFGDVNDALTITRTTELNVIALNRIDYTDSTDVLTLEGGPDDYFIVNVGEDVRFMSSGSGIQAAGGLPANHILFNIPSTGFSDGLTEEGATIVGTFLVTHRGVFLSGGEVDGAIMAGNDIYVSSGAVVRQNTFLPEPAPLLLLLTAGGVFVAGALVRRLRAKMMK